MSHPLGTCRQAGSCSCHLILPFRPPLILESWEERRSTATLGAHVISKCTGPTELEQSKRRPGVVGGAVGWAYQELSAD